VQRRIERVTKVKSDREAREILRIKEIEEIEQKQRVKEQSLERWRKMLQENAGLAEEKGLIKDANKEREESERK